MPFPLLIPRTRGEGPSAVGRASLDDSPIVALTKVCYQANDKDWYAYALV